MRNFLTRLFFSIDRLLKKILPVSALHIFHSCVAKLARRIYPNTSINANLLDALSESRQGRLSAPSMPDWVFQDLEELKELDAKLHPQGKLVSSANFLEHPWTYDLPGKIYFDLINSFPDKIDIVLIVPWLKTGGADLGAIHFANALAESFSKSVLVLSTEDSPSPWSTKLSSKVSFFELGGQMSGLYFEHKIDILVRLLLQTKPHTMHIMNSRLAWESVKRNGIAIKQYTQIFSSLYCDDISPSGQKVGFAQNYLMECASVLSGVISDNKAMPKNWIDSFGINPSIFHTVYFPAPFISLVDQKQTSKRVLWAGRMDRQKRPDILAEVAKQLPNLQFDVYGTSVLHDRGKKDIAFPSNVNLKGSFDSFASLVQKESYFAYLYTSQWDGLPNVLLEAASFGIPIVASNVGAVSEFLDSEQIVNPFDKVDDYANLLNHLHLHPETCALWSKRQLERVTNNHSHDCFLRAIERLPNYLPQ